MEIEKNAPIERWVGRELAKGELFNPAWELIKTIPHDNLFSTHDDGRFRPTSYGEGLKQHYRTMVTGRITWAIPEPGALDFVADIAKDKGIVEIGAGTGYWAWMLSQRGVDVNAYDPYPVLDGENGYFRDDERSQLLNLGEIIEFYPVVKGGAEVLAEPENRDRVLFLCWPNYDNSWAYEAVQAFRGQTIIYIGEGPGGCTGDASFHKLLAGNCGCWNDECTHDQIVQGWEERQGYGYLPQWGGLHDDLYVYERMTKELEIDG